MITLSPGKRRVEMVDINPEPEQAMADIPIPEKFVEVDDPSAKIWIRAKRRWLSPYGDGQD